MRKEIGGLLWMLSMFFIVSCGFEIPESLTVTGTPGVHLPLGSPFGEKDSINNYIGQAKIGEMIGGNDPDSKVTLYDYQGNGTDPLEVQTYLVRNEIAKLNLDLEKHIKEADDITVPPLVIPSIPGNSGTSPVYITKSGPSYTKPSEPLFEISLGAIEQWMKDVKLDNTAGITIQGGADLQGTLELRIPQLGIELGIDGYSKGNPDNGDLVFTGKGYTLFETTGAGDQVKPESTKIEVYARLAGSPPVGGGTYEMALNFKWTEATLYPGTDGQFDKTYTVNFGDLINYLGNAKLKAVPAYVFINGLPDHTDGKMTLSIRSDTVVNDIKLKAFPENLFDDKTNIAIGPIPEPSIKNFDLADLFTTEDSTLTYVITVQKVTITPSDNQTITADLLIKIPLEFEVTGEPKNPEYQDKYVKLDLGNMLPQPSNDGGDLFGRTGKEDDLVNTVGDVSIMLQHYTNTVIPTPIAFSLWDEGSSYSNIIHLEVGTIPTLALGKVFPYPFSPRYEILIPKDTDENTGTLKIGRGTDFDFSLVIEASANIKQTVNF